MKFQELIKDPESTLEGSEINEVLSCLKSHLTEETMTDIVTIMHRKEVQRYIQFLLNKIVEGQELNGGEFQNLYLLCNILQSIYNYSGKDTGVSDYDYDKLYEAMNTWNNLGTEIITTPLLSKNNVVHHTYTSLPGTLEKVYTLTEEEQSSNEHRSSLTDWVKSRERDYKTATGKSINLWQEEIYVFPKWDGVSVSFEFDEHQNLKRALLRGDTSANETKDVSFIFYPITSRIIDKGMSGKAYGKKTEVMMHEKDFKKYNKEFGEDYHSTRSIVSSIVNGGERDGREDLLEVIGLRTSIIENGEEKLQELSENVFERPYLRCRLKDVDAIRKFAYDHTEVDGLRCDGAVIYIIDPKIRKILGRKDHKNKYEVAYKFNEEVAYTQIEGITFEVSPFGRVFPTANFKTKKMKGNDISNVSLGSIARFNKLKLAKGDTVKILYEIIPYLVMDENDPKCKRSGKPRIEAPSNCPLCGEPLEINPKGTILNCINPNCGCRKIGKINNYIKKMGLKNIGERTIARFYEAGFVKDIKDLYKLRKHYNELTDLPGFSDTSVTNILLELESTKRVTPAKLMGSIGIECIGEKTFDKIFRRYEVEDLLEFADEKDTVKLTEISGIGQPTAKKILDGIKENKKLIEFLMEKITIRYDLRPEPNFEVYFHKIRSKTAEELVKQAGGANANSFTKKTAMLIVPNDLTGDTAKTEKAKTWGIPIVKIGDLESVLTLLSK